MLGPNLPFKGSLYSTLSGNDFRDFPVQIMIGDPRKYEIAKGITEEDIAMTRQLNRRTFYIHATHVCVPSSEKKYVREISLDWILKTLEIIKDLNSKLIFHIGSGKTEDLAPIINRIDPNLRKKILLENSARTNTDSAEESWLKLFNLYEKIKGEKPGFCLDTAHAFADGICDFSSEEEVRLLFDRVFTKTGKYPELIHLNDSKSNFGSGVDKHSPLGKGKIFGTTSGREALKALVIISESNKIDLICETSDYNSDCDVIDSLF